MKRIETWLFATTRTLDKIGGWVILPMIATIVTPRDCSRCHPQVAKEFERSHHAAGKPLSLAPARGCALRIRPAAGIQ